MKLDPRVYALACELQPVCSTPRASAALIYGAIGNDYRIAMEGMGLCGFHDGAQYATALGLMAAIVEQGEA